MALAFAELGDFEQAVEWQQRIVLAGERSGASPEALAMARQRLEELKSRQPIRTGTDP